MNGLLTFLPTLSHLLIGFYFVFMGTWNIYHWKPTIDVMLEDKIPSPIFLMSIGVSCQIILGFMIMGNTQIKIAALLLIIFTLISAFMFHPFWKFKAERKKYHMSKFVDSLTVIMGALILLINSISPLNNLAEILSN